MEENLELRMYSLVLYQLTPIQQGIQSYHATVEATINFHKPYSIKEEDYYNWAKNWKTVIIFNGGTTQTMEQHIDYLATIEVGYSIFKEPDLGDITTAVSFIVDERVFNKEKYPDYDFLGKATSLIKHKNLIDMSINDEYAEWVESIGGVKNALLRNFLKNFRFV